MKKLRIRTSLLALAGAVFLSVAGMGGPAKVYAAEPGKGEISVSGSGSVNVNPDVAYVSLGVTIHDVSPKVALNSNNEATANVISAIQGMGIAEKDIRTSGFTMRESYDYSTSPEKVTGYTVTNNLTIVVRDISIVGDLLGIAADAGANNFNGVEFGLLDSVSAYNKALALAVAEAAGKAQTIAAALGKTLGSPASITENSNYYTPVYAGELNAAADMAAGSVPVQAGKLTITAGVQIIYEYVK